MLHDDPGNGHRLAVLAADAGVHPAHLARTFRRHFRASVGAYARRLRLDGAARRLAMSNDSMAAIAVEAGFADQSHLTREFRRWLGVTPGQYRRQHRRASAPAGMAPG